MATLSRIKSYVFVIVSILCISQVKSQDLHQTVRGIITDADSKTPLVGASVIIEGSQPIIGTITDANGYFRLENIPVGRAKIKISYLGYESKNISNIIVDSGKETILELSLQESVKQLDEVVIKPTRKNGEAINEMAIVSSRSVSPEQTTRFTGTFNDPSKILSNFAGVTNTGDGSNDIIVRGNSPKYIHWRLEGVEISNPNHFADQNYTLGGFSALNNNILAKSDFLTGAFTPENGNALSGIYDVKLRQGNNEKMERTFGFGALGTDITLEGPFKKGYNGSFLLNYRYSTIKLISDLKIIEDVPDALDFQDITAKIVLPTKHLGTFSYFFLGGKNGFTFEDIRDDMLPTPGDRGMQTEIIEDVVKDNYLFHTGLNHRLILNDRSYLKTTIAYSGEGQKYNIYESQIIPNETDNGLITYDTINRALNYKNKLNQSAYKTSISYSNKINSRNKIQIGSSFTLYDYVNSHSILDDSLTNRISLINTNEKIGVLNNYISWKHRLNNSITLVGGLHNMNLLLNNTKTLEPRFALNLKINQRNSLHLGYGNHSHLEEFQNYFIRTTDENGKTIEPNKNLKPLRANHFVAGYKKNITPDLLATIELYYQSLYDLPVENDSTSYYATINGGDEFRYVDLVNKGKGENYGMEITLERYFTKNYYYLVNASLFESKYTSLDGIERNTQHNYKYLFNILCGKEFTELGKKKNKSLAVNMKLFYGGGRKIIPLLRDAQGNINVNPLENKFWDYSKAYENKIEDNYQLTVSFSYKIHRPKATHELFIDLQNITGYQAKITEYYDEEEPNSVGYLKFPVGLFPNFMYRVYF